MNARAPLTAVNHMATPAHQPDAIANTLAAMQKMMQMQQDAQAKLMQTITAVQT